MKLNVIGNSILRNEAAAMMLRF